MTISWPVVLPNALLSGYSRSTGNASTTTKMDAGQPRIRQRFTAENTGVALKFRMTQSEYRLFESWWKHKAKLGAEWVNITLTSGIGEATHTLLFSPPVVKPLTGGNGIWEVAISAIERDAPVLSETELDAILEENPEFDALVLNAALFRQIVRTHLPNSFNGVPI